MIEVVTVPREERPVAVVPEPVNDTNRSHEEETPAARYRTKAAERMRRHRARRKRHCRIVAIEVGDFDIAGLVRLGLLAERDCEDVVAVGDALHRLFDETIAR